ncbi:MAG: hypothetical protein WKF97_22555 [Chitinophagaceae bacterium]
MIYVFKTSVTNKRKARRLKPILDQLLPLSKWNFDLDDCDNILRIDSVTDIVEKVIWKLKSFGFECEELA